MADIKATIKQNVIKATVKGSGAQGPAGATGPQGPGSNLRMMTWVIDNPAVGGIPGPAIEEDHEVIKIKSYTQNANSVTFNIEERTSPGTTGTDLMATEQVAVPGVASTTSFSNDELETGNYLWLDIESVSGTPTRLVITLLTQV